MKINRLDFDVRMPTGPLKFGDDWPGVFIRGDEAQFFASAIENGDLSKLQMLAELLRSCRVAARHGRQGTKSLVADPHGS